VAGWSDPVRPIFNFDEKITRNFFYFIPRRVRVANAAAYQRAFTSPHRYRATNELSN